MTMSAMLVITMVIMMVMMVMTMMMTVMVMVMMKKKTIMNMVLELQTTHFLKSQAKHRLFFWSLNTYTQPFTKWFDIMISDDHLPDD